MSSPSGTLIDNKTSPDLVPSNEVKANLRGKKQPDPLFEMWVQQIAAQIDNENRAEEIIRQRKITRNQHYYRGRQSGYVSEMTNQWVDVPSGPLYTKNYVRALVKKIAAQWSASNTELKMHARSDKQEAILGARMANKLIQYYQQILMGQRVKQRECKFCKLDGEVYRYWYWDANAGPWVDEPIYEDSTVKLSEDSFMCPACGASGESSPEMMACPGCGNPDLVIEPGQSAETQVVSGTQKVRAGDVVLNIISSLNVKVDLNAEDEDDSLYLRYRRLIRKEIMMSMFPNFRMHGSGSSDQGLMFQSQLQKSPGNTATGTGGVNYATSTGTNEHMVQFDQIWLEPAMYFDYEFPVDTTVGPEGATVIPQGTRAIEMFPDGLYIALANNTQLLDIRPEDKKKHWALLVDDLIPNSIHGDGIDDIIEEQDKLNDATSMFFEKLMRETNPPLFYDQRMFRGEQFRNEPGATNPIQNLMPGMKISDGVFMPPYQNGNAMALIQEFAEVTQRDMVEFSGAQSTQGSAPDTDPGTATAAQLNHDQAQGLSAVPLALRSEVDVKTFTCIVELIRENWNAPRYLPLLGSHGKMEGFWFEKSDIPEDFIITAIDHSWMPRNETERRNDFIASMQVSPALPLGPYTPGIPGFLSRQMSERFNLELDEDGYSAMARRATYILNNLLTDAKEMAQQMPPIDQANPETMLRTQMGIQQLLQKNPVNMRVDDATIHTEIIKDWYMTDEGLEADDFIINVLNARLDELQQMGGMQQMRQLASNPMAQMQMEQEQGNNTAQQPPSDPSA